MKALLKVCCLAPSSLVFSSGVNSRSHCVALREVPPYMLNCSSHYFLFLCRGNVREKLAFCDAGLRGKSESKGESSWPLNLLLLTFCISLCSRFCSSFSAAFAAFSAAFSLAFSSLCRLHCSTCSAFSRFILSFSSISVK